MFCLSVAKPENMGERVGNELTRSSSVLSTSLTFGGFSDPVWTELGCCEAAATCLLVAWPVFLASLSFADFSDPVWTELYFNNPTMTFFGLFVAHFFTK